eukprot:TRINITY_DN18743_c1_g1_i1.p1 TRINITY_DN18743_c1_g1~~TRINITY_DN18743_c1_g1_i1.p1  ORF type:complete len:1134 (-),score=210.36 TRINITY_DN18743_c1_g1_i1:514-3858(-)
MSLLTTHKCFLSSKQLYVNAIAQFPRQRKSSVPTFWQRRHCSPIVRSRRIVKAYAQDQPKQQPLFANRLELDGLQKGLASLPNPAFMGLRAFLALGFGAVGLYAGTQTPEGIRTFARVIGGVLGVLAGNYLGNQANEKRQSSAAVELHNLFVDSGDPMTVSPEQVEQIAKKFALDLRTGLIAERKQMYDQFLSYHIPPGDQPLVGNEAELIKGFKNLIQLSDEDAAPVHIEVGRRLSRSRLEVGTNRDLAMEERRAFQKLVYVSRLVFGEQKSAFLLPWVRVFNMSPTGVEFAVRDYAKQLFKSKITNTGDGKLQTAPAYLQNLRQWQLELQLKDEYCDEIVREAAQERLVEWMDAASQCVKQRGRTKDYTIAMDAVHSLLRFNREMQFLQQQQESTPAEERTLVPGLGRVAIFGTKYETTPGLGNDLRDIFRVYLEETLRKEGLFSEQLEKDVEDLKIALALSPKDTYRVVNQVKSRVYRAMLREEFTSGRLDAAPEKGVILNELIQKIRFDGPTALDLHMSLYRQKLESVLENQVITDEEEAELDRLRRLLCIPQDKWKAVNDEVMGKIFRDVVQEAMDQGIERFGLDDKDKVKKCIDNVRIDRNTAKEELKHLSHKELQKYIAQSRMQKDRLSQAKELKKMVFFSNIVIAPLLEVVNEGMEQEEKKDQDAAMKEFAEIMKQAKAQAEEEKEKEEKEEKQETEEAAAATSEDGKEEAAASEPTAEVVSKAEEESPVSSETSEKSDIAEEPAKETKEVEAQEEEAPKIRTLAKAEKAAADREQGETVTAGGRKVEMKSQKEINLRDVLSERDREETYKLYLMYTMSGDVISMPMGGQIVVERDEQEFARLSQLGDILGLNQFEVYKVHQGIAEQAFKAQVEGISAGGDLFGKEQREKVENLRKQMGLTEDAANTIIKGIQNKKLIGNLQAYKAQGALTYQKILDLKDEGIEVENLVSKDVRTQLFKQEMEKLFTSGKGDFDKDKLFSEIAGNLAIEEKTVKTAVEDYAKDKRRPVFVQAAAYLRQRNQDGAVKTLNNYVNISKALGATDVPEWDREELQDMYGLYCMKVSDEEQRKNIQQALGLKDEEVSALHDMVSSGSFKFDQEQKEEVFF